MAITLNEPGVALNDRRWTMNGIAVVTITFAPMPTTLADALRTHHRPVARLRFLADDLVTVLHEVPARLVDGSVQMDRFADVFRTAQVALANDSGLYAPRRSSDLVWPSRIVQIERGAMVGEAAQYRPLITGLIDEPHEAEREGTVTFSVSSRLALADQVFTDPLTIPAGLGIAAGARMIAEAAGLGTSDALYDLDDDGQRLPSARTYGIADNMLTSMIRLAFDAGFDLWDSGAGVLTMRAFVDPATVTPAWDFSDGVTLTALERTLRRRMAYNRAIAIGTAPDAYPIRAEAKVTNPADPLFWTPSFDRPRAPYVSANIKTQQMANAVAGRLLIEGALYEEAVGAVSSPIPLVEARQVVRLSGAGVDDAFLLDTVRIPIGRGTMQMTTKRVRSLIA